ncbi:MAG: histidine kinase, partial [bacterium]
EQRVIERTQDLERSNTALMESLETTQKTQKQLIAQEKMASLGTLTAGIAHEIKNPLNFVNNFSEIASEVIAEIGELLEDHKGSLPFEVLTNLEEMLIILKEATKSINQNGKRANKIVSDMLAHVWSETNNKRSTDLNALIQESVNLFSHGIKANTSEFSPNIITNFDSSIPTIQIAPESIRRVLINLLSNAQYAVKVKHKDAVPTAYSPTIQVQTINHEKFIKIVISDNGVGIPKAMMDKVLTPFFTTKPPGQGTGLGLSISYEIVVEEHSGKFSITTEEGQYTNFSIQLPKNIL